MKHETLSPDEAPDGSPSGFTCPRCGGSMWETGANSLAFKCRIGHALSLSAMLAEHGAVRRTRLIEAGRLLAEAAALNRRVAHYARQRGHPAAATQLDREAAALDERSDEVMRLASSVLAEAGTGSNATPPSTET